MHQLARRKEISIDKETLTSLKRNVFKTYSTVPQVHTQTWVLIKKKKNVPEINTKMVNNEFRDKLPLQAKRRTRVVSSITSALI